MRNNLLFARPEPRLMEQIIQKQLPHGNMTGKAWNCDGILLGYAKTVFSKKGSWDSYSDDDMVRLHFGLKGDYKFTYHELGKTYDLIGGHHNLMYSSPFSMEVQNKTGEIETFGIQFPRLQFINFLEKGDELLKRFCEKVLEGKSCILSNNWGSIDPTLHLSIQQVYHQPFSGQIQKHFLLSKSMELLVMSANSCESSKTNSQPFLKNKSDKEKIIAARDLIIESASSPPGLSEISRHIGLNEFKLKKGFKEMFHTTVFGYLTEQRLYLAKRYLLDTEKAAADIAIELGYATPQHFNNAFKKKFGVTPIGLRK